MLRNNHTVLPSRQGSTRQSCWSSSSPCHPACGSIPLASGLEGGGLQTDDTFSISLCDLRIRLHYMTA